MADRSWCSTRGNIEQVRLAARPLRPPGQPLRRRLHRLAAMNFIGGEAAQRHGAGHDRRSSRALKASRDGEGWEGTVSVAEHLGSDTFLYVDVPEHRQPHRAFASASSASRRAIASDCSPTRAASTASIARKGDQRLAGKAAPELKRRPSQQREQSCISKCSSSPAASPS